jgi:hypothetical protein
MCSAEMNTQLPTPKKGHVITSAGQEIHEDARVFVQESDRTQYGGARIVDALTFIKQHPFKYLYEGIIAGLFFYHDKMNEVSEEDRRAIKYNGPDLYAMNGWEAIERITPTKQAATKAMKDERAAHGLVGYHIYYGTIGEETSTPHEPGPWKWGRESLRIYSVSTGQDVGEVYFRPSLLHRALTPREIANGDLLASAPELLAENERLRAALEAIIEERHERGIRWPVLSHENAIATTKAALARKGEK